MPFWAFNVVSIRSLLLMSSNWIHIAFNLNFPDAAQYICYSFLETVVLTLELARFSTDLSKEWFVSCDAKLTLISNYQSFTLKADFSAEPATLFCFFCGHKVAKFY